MFRVLALVLCAALSLASAEPATPTSFHRALLGDAPLMIDQTGNRLSAKYLTYLGRQKYVFLYFGASTCVPCTKFTPELVAWYHANGGGKNFEIIMVGGDFTTDEIKDYMKSYKMPWLAIERGKAFEKMNPHFEQVKEKYGCKYQPTLVLLNEHDEVLARSNDGDKYLGANVVFKKYLELTKAK